MARDERPPGPLHARVLRWRRAAGRTRPGRKLKRLLGRETRIPVAAEPDPARLIVFPGEDELPLELRDRAVFDAAMAERSRARPRARATPANVPLHASRDSDNGEPIVNLVLVSHCNFKGNSAFHVLAVATELHRRGLSPVVAVPDEPHTVDDIGRPPFPVMTYDEAAGGGLVFPDGRGPDLVHAWTPRELVRRITVDLVRAHGCRYVVHLEDNEEAVLSAEHGGIDVEALKELPGPLLDRIVRPRQSHPLRTRRFLEQSAGMTVLIERLLEFVPAGIPAVVIPAGFDEAVLSPRRSRDAVRAELRLEPTDLAVVYPGNIHMVNMSEMRSLYEAVALLRQGGLPVVLVKTGWGSTQTVDFPALGPGVRDLGWVARGAIPDLLGAADILVQPGGPDLFNDYRFPSKLPEFLASGRPVVLPRTNVGLLLKDGEEALTLESGDAREIAAAVRKLVEDPDLRVRIGAAGRKFALRDLRWSRSAGEVHALYAQIARSDRPAPSAWALDGADLPARLVALVDDAPTASAAREAGAHAVVGFCLNPTAPVRDFRFCLLASETQSEQEVLLSSPLHIREGGQVLLAAREAVAAEAWSSRTRLAGIDARVALIETRRAGDLLRPKCDRDDDRGSHRGVIDAADRDYAWVLRKVVFRSLLLRPSEQPVIFIDASAVWADRSLRAAWLAATKRAFVDGTRQYFTSRRLALSDADIDRLLASQ